ncbi:MAG: isopentenyl-diphosphate Delta-isomerase [Bacteroidia bacterium]|nr:isopentenyl-diphosphate Delta-isomerase [Bacteroidia bacterium]
MNRTEEVILVNEQDSQIGLMEKLEAHQKGLLHRAFSVFIFNSKGDLLLQQRALSKYHSPGLWTNTCCSHPRAGEENAAAAHRRLKEEMGFDCDLEYQGFLIYKVQFENGLFEHELDHVFTGVFNGIPQLNSDEVAAFRWTSLQNLQQEIDADANRFTHWLQLILKQKKWF